MQLRGSTLSNLRRFLTFYFIYALLFNLVVSQSSLLTEQNHELTHGREISITGITYSSGLTCWNSTKEATNYRYLICRFSVSRKVPISRGLKVDFSAESLDLFELEQVREDVIIKLPFGFKGRKTLKLKVQLYDVWWIGVIVPHHVEVVLTFECTDEECHLRKIEKGRVHSPILFFTTSKALSASLLNSGYPSSSMVSGSGTPSSSCQPLSL